MSTDIQPPDERPEMSVHDRPAPIAEQKAQQRLRQEQETFDQKKIQDARWFDLRMTMGKLAIIIMLAVIVVCVLLIFNTRQGATVKGMAAGALFVDILGLVGALWWGILNPGSMTQLAPLTEDNGDKSDSPGEEPLDLSSGDDLRQE